MLTHIQQITVAMLAGIILGPHVLDLIKTDRIADFEVLVQEVSRLVIAIQLMAIALKYVEYHIY
jgi:NhaP-type Na+/H+ or K+/H+ antiporter